MTLHRLYCLLVIEAGSRRVDIPGGDCKPGRAAGHPADPQPAGRPRRPQRGFRFLVRDRAGQFTASFDAALACAGIEAVKISPPKLRGERPAERFAFTARTEDTDRMLIFGERHLRLVLAAYEAHCNGRRPHRSRRLRPPGRTAPSPTSAGSGSSAGPSSAASSANTSEPRRSPGQVWWPSSGTPHHSVRRWLRPVRAGSHRNNGHGRFGWPQCSARTLNQARFSLYQRQAQHIPVEVRQFFIMPGIYHQPKPVIPMPASIAVRSPNTLSCRRPSVRELVRDCPVCREHAVPPLSLARPGLRTT